MLSITSGFFICLTVEESKREKSIRAEYIYILLFHHEHNKLHISCRQSAKNSTYTRCGNQTVQWQRQRK